MALKVIRLPPDAEGGIAERFHHEAARAVALDHPHVATLARFGAGAGQVWLATEFIEGPSLAERLTANGPLPVAEALKVAHQVAVALEYAHRQRVTHGNLEPTRVLLERGSWVRVAGFGAGAVLGMPLPGAEVPPKVSDQRALARLVRACLTGTPSTDGALPPLPELRPQIVDALRRAEDARPAYRFAGPVEFVTAMSEVDPAKSDRPTPPPRPGPFIPNTLLEDDYAEPPRSRLALAAAAGVALLAAVGVLAWAGWGRTARSDLPADIVSPGLEVPPVANVPLLEPDPPPPPEPQPRRVPAPSRPAPRPPAPTSPAPRLGHLAVNSSPWAVLYVDGRRVGNTPQTAVALSAGTHRLRLEHDGFRPLDLAIVVQPGDTLRMTNLVLEEIRP